MANEAKYKLSEGDPQVGLLNEDGSVKKWPRERIDGQPFERRVAYASFRVDKGHFVILPPNTHVSKEDFELSVAKVAPPSPSAFKTKDTGSDS